MTVKTLNPGSLVINRMRLTTKTMIWQIKADKQLESGSYIENLERELEMLSNQTRYVGTLIAV